LGSWASLGLMQFNLRDMATVFYTDWVAAALSAKLVLTFADKRCHVVSAVDPRGRIFGFLDRSHYYFFQVAPQLYSRGRVDPVPDTLIEKVW
jgi:hypothetical protein